MSFSRQRLLQIGYHFKFTVLQPVFLHFVYFFPGLIRFNKYTQLYSCGKSSRKYSIDLFVAFT